MPFNTEEFLGVFKSYNNSIWPFQIILIISALYIIYSALKKKNYNNIVINNILIFYWLWIGVVYDIIFFSAINPAAYVFGAIFILQALLFVKAGIIDKKLEFEFRNGCKRIYRWIYNFICINYLSAFGYLPWTYLPGKSHIWSALSDNYIHIWYFSLGREENSDLYHYHSCNLGCNRIYRRFKTRHKGRYRIINRGSTNYSFNCER